MTTNLNVKTWSEFDISPGCEKEKEKEKELKKANLLLLILSADFLDSDEYIDVKSKLNGTTRIIPVLWRACNWKMDPFLQKFKPLPIDEKFINSVENKDEYFADICEKIKALKSQTTSLNEGAKQFTTTSKMVSKETCQIQVIINGDLENFTPENKLKFKNILAAALDIDSELVSILEVKEGSIKITIELPLESAEKLISLFHKKNVALDQLQSEFEIKKINRIVENEKLSSDTKDALNNDQSSIKGTRIVKLINILSKAEKKLLRRHIKQSNEDGLFKDLANYLLDYSNNLERLKNKAIIKTLNIEVAPKKFGQLRFQIFQFAENFILNNWLSDLPKNDMGLAVQKDMLLLDMRRINDYSLHINRIGDKSREYIETMNHLDLFYSLAKLKFTSEIKVWNMLTIEKTESFAFDEMEPLINALDSSNKGVDVQQPIIKLYQLSNLLANDTNQKNQNALKNEILKNENSLDKNKLSQLLIFGMNYNAYLSRQNNIDLSENSYELFKLGLKREIFIVNGLIKPDILIHFAYLCTHFSDDEEIDSVMKQYELRLSPDLKKITLKLCKIFILWYRKEYKKIIASTITISNKNIPFFLHYKLMRIKSFYELSQTNELNIEINYVNDMLAERKELYKYLRLKKGMLSSDSFKSLLNFSHVLLKLVDPNSSKKHLLKLMNFEYAQNFERRWLMKKIQTK